MRINKNDHLRENASILFPNSLNSFFKEIYRDQFGEFVCVYWGLKSFFAVVSTKLRNARFVLLFFSPTQSNSIIKFGNKPVFPDHR